MSVFTGGKQRPESYRVSVVLPAHNEEGNIAAAHAQLCEVLQAFPRVEILFVDDGSRDGTLGELRRLGAQDPRVGWISLSRNFGHQNALKAGLDHATGDCVISMDCDLQHPAGLIPALVQKWQDGFDVVHTIREEDSRLPWLKRASSRLFYQLMSRLSEVTIRAGAADFRVMDRAVVEQLKSLHENHLFLRGLVPWMGFRQCELPYTPEQRRWGQSKYSVKRMIRFAADGVTSFSIRPLRLSTILGLSVSGIAFAYAAYAFALKMFTDRAIEGWTSVLVSVLLLSGVQLVALGILGEYLGKMFMEAKGRPNYIIREAALPARPAVLPPGVGRPVTTDAGPGAASSSSTPGARPNAPSGGLNPGGQAC